MGGGVDACRGAVRGSGGLVLTRELGGWRGQRLVGSGLVLLERQEGYISVLQTINTERPVQT